MGRYIDSDKIEEWAVENYGVVIPEYYDIIDAVELAEDVAPVVHAHWIEQYDAGGKFFMCSHCAQSNGNIYYKYCPDCGAIMDEEV